MSQRISFSRNSDLSSVELNLLADLSRLIVTAAHCTVHCHTLRSLINGSLIEGFCAQFTFDTLFAFAGLGEKFSTASLYFDHGMCAQYGRQSQTWTIARHPADTWRRRATRHPLLLAARRRQRRTLSPLALHSATRPPSPLQLLPIGYLLYSLIDFFLRCACALRWTAPSLKKRSLICSAVSFSYFQQHFEVA